MTSAEGLSSAQALPPNGDEPHHLVIADDRNHERGVGG